jgi:outer membrane protein
LKQSQAAVKAGIEDLQQSKYTTSLNVAVNYLTVLQNQELVVAANNQVDISKFQADRTERLVNAGSLPQTDLLNLQAQLANDRASLTTAENNLRIARLTLMQSMNLPAQDDFTIQQINLEDPTINAYDRTAAQVYETALQTLHSVKSADLLVQSNTYAVSAARGNLFPRLALGAGMNSFYSSSRPYVTSTVVSNQTVVGFVNGDKNIPVLDDRPFIRDTESKYTFTNQIWDNLGQFIGLNLSVPIINGWQTRTQVSRAVVQRKISELDAQTVRVQVRQDIELAYNNMEAAASQYQANKQQVESLSLAFRAAETRFNVGAINSTDYNVAKANLILAQANLIQAKYNYYFRVKVLDFYQNKPLTF